MVQHSNFWVLNSARPFWRHQSKAGNAAVHTDNAILPTLVSPGRRKPSQPHLRQRVVHQHQAAGQPQVQQLQLAVGGVAAKGRRRAGTSVLRAG